MSGLQTAAAGLLPAIEPSDNVFQARLLDGVSRTFALTIPQLPAQLCQEVSNAYLLCRIVDTIEDETALTAQQKRRFCRQFVGVVTGDEDSHAFSNQLAPLLSPQTMPAEHELIRSVPRVIKITHSFGEPQRQALAKCVKIMAQGMADFQAQNLQRGLKTMEDMDRYCYYVAGVVGEMLTRLFCHYSKDIAKNQETLMPLAVSFGQGLQMTNILKDIWDDYQRGICWLPQEIFAATGFDLAGLAPSHHNRHFADGLERLIGIAHGHLRNALQYVLLIPSYEKGIRDFCLWALGMAVLTLRKISHNKYFSDSSQVKISRRSVKATVLATRLTRSHDLLLKFVFNLAGLGLYSAKQPEMPSQNRADR